MVVDSFAQAGERRFTFTGLDPSPWQSARTTNASAQPMPHQDPDRAALRPNRGHAASVRSSPSGLVQMHKVKGQKLSLSPPSQCRLTLPPEKRILHMPAARGQGCPQPSRDSQAGGC
jgi:hypothetical protein